MEWAQVLVIILSTFLAIFLVLAIILTVIVIRITKQIKEITGSVQRTTNNVEKAVVGFTNVTSPVYLVKTLNKYIKQYKKSKK
jgi:hypothetical protein